MKHIHCLLLCLGSAAFLAACASPDAGDKVATSSPAAKKCESDQVQTGSMLHSHNCQQNGNLNSVDPDTMKQEYFPMPKGASLH